MHICVPAMVTSFLCVKAEQVVVFCFIALVSNRLQVLSLPLFSIYSHFGAKRSDGIAVAIGMVDIPIRLALTPGPNAARL